ncbi:MAG TPA: hypothetical protein VF773_17580 [Verrucomicrobiae bacterium]
MIDLATAVSIFRKEFGQAAGEPEKQCIDRGSYFFFAWPEPLFGSIGVIIDKKNGAVVNLGSGCSREEAFWGYEHGCYDEGVDLVITSYKGDVDDLIDVLTKTPPSQLGQMHGPGRKGWYARMAQMPAVVFRNTKLWSYIPGLREATDKGLLTFEVRKHLPEE